MIVRTDDQLEPFVDVTSLTWLEVVPVKVGSLLPQLPEPSLSAQVMASRPFDGSMAIDG